MTALFDDQMEATFQLGFEYAVIVPLSYNQKQLGSEPDLGTR